MCNEVSIQYKSFNNQKHPIKLQNKQKQILSNKNITNHKINNKQYKKTKIDAETIKIQISKQNEVKYSL